MAEKVPRIIAGVPFRTSLEIHTRPIPSKARAELCRSVEGYEICHSALFVRTSTYFSRISCFLRFCLAFFLHFFLVLRANCVDNMPIAAGISSFDVEPSVSFSRGRAKTAAIWLATE